MKFEYEKQSTTLEAYGKVYEIPTKTIDFVDAVNAAAKEIAGSKTAEESVRATKAGVALFIGEEEAERIYPEERLNKIDTDEIAAFWWALNRASNEATQAVIAKYMPNRTIKTNVQR